MQGVGGQDFRENVFLTVFVWQLPCFGFSCAKTTNQHVLGPFTSLGSDPEVKRRGQPLPPPPHPKSSLHSALLPWRCRPACSVWRPRPFWRLDTSVQILILLNEVVQEFSLKTVFLGQSFSEITWQNY